MRQGNPGSEHPSCSSPASELVKAQSRQSKGRSFREYPSREAGCNSMLATASFKQKARRVLRRIVDIGAATEQEVVDRLEVSQLLSSLENMILGGTEAEGLLTLGLGTGEDNHMASHGSCQLDSQMAETTDTHDTHAVSRADTIFRQDSPHGSTGTHQRRSIGGVISIGDRDNATGIPDDTLAERSQVVIVATIFFLVLAVLVPSYNFGSASRLSHRKSFATYQSSTFHKFRKHSG